METILKNLEIGMIGLAARCSVNSKINQLQVELGGPLQQGYQAGFDPNQGQGMQVSVPNDMKCVRTAKFNRHK